VPHIWHFFVEAIVKSIVPQARCLIFRRVIYKDSICVQFRVTFPPTTDSSKVCCIAWSAKFNIMHPAGFALSLSLFPSLSFLQSENIKAYREHRRRRDEEMPIFVSHRYFQRADGKMQRLYTVLYHVNAPLLVYLPGMHRTRVRQCVQLYIFYIVSICLPGVYHF